MPEKPPISIITVNLNNLVGLKKTIRSVLDQDFRDYEFLIIDGDSKDGSKEYLEEQKSRINYVSSEPDSGIYNAMNKGIKASTGRYLLFLNSGDWLMDDKVLSDISGSLTGCDFLYGNIIRVYEDRKVGEKGTDEISLKTFFKGSLNHQALFINKKMFHKYGFYDEGLRIVSDWKFNLKCIALKDSLVKYIDRDISYYDMSGVSNDNELRNREREMVFKELFPISIYKDYQYFLEMESFLNSYRLKNFRVLDENKIVRKLNSVLFRILGK